MNAQHTPGPWTIEKTSHDTEIVAGKYHICNVGESVRCSENEAKANARLIASAPDLLAALQAFAAAGNNFTGWHPAYEDAIIQARAAIARATGAA